eukprot:10524170-Ditylum_brightwellii.AAC.1
MDKKVCIICNKIEGAVLGSVAGVPFMEEERESIAACVNSATGCVDVKTTDTLVDARAYTNKNFDFDS